MNKILTNVSSSQSRILDTDFLDRLTLYQSANSSPEVVKRNFLVRIAEFDLIVSALRRKKVADPAQHELILGRRGSGKSTLLRRIQIEIDEDPDLASRYIAINLAEEQAAIYRLSDLWFEVLQELMNRFDTVLKLRSFDDFDDNSAYARYLYTEIHRLLQTAGKKAVLLLDNLDRILQNFDDDGNLLREILQNYNDLQIIGGSTRMDEHFWHYDKPFYEFFRRHRLEGLHFEEVHLLLNHWSVDMGLPLLYDYALKHRGRIEAIRILTDGLPRALQFFIQILLHDANQYGFDYLRKIMDRATPLYQERLNNLTASQRKIVQEMAFWWEAAPTKVLVEKCRIEGKTIAALLRQLEQYGIVETIQTGKKNHLYRIAERFFNMWLIVTQGNPDQKRKAKYLTHFLESWYDATELKALSEQHLTELKTGQLSYDKAMVMSKALSQSKYIGVEERDALIDLTLELHPAGGLDSELPRKYEAIKIEIDKLWDENRYDNALQKIEEIENEEDGVKFFLQAYCYKQLKRYKEAEKYYLQAIEKGHVSALYNLAILYDDQSKNVEAESYYLQAIEKGDGPSLTDLANLYRKQGKNAEAGRYYLQANEKGYVFALNNLANLYKDEGKNAEAESCYLQAIKKGHVDALNNLAILYKSQGKNAEAENYYLQAIEKGYIYAVYNLANLYNDQGKNAEAESYYLQAIEKEDVNALNNLAVLYADQGKNVEAESYYLQAIGKGHVDALYNLAILYNDQGKNAEAESYYLQAIEKGHMGALNNLAILYNDQGKNAEAESYYLQAIEKGHMGALNNLAILYVNQGKIVEAESYYLQAIEKGYVGALYNLANLYNDQGKNAEAESYYLQAIEKEDVNALNNLAVLYADQGKIVEAESYYLQAIEKEVVNALNNLANLYVNQGKIVEAESYYLQAIEKEVVNALNNLANLYVNQGKIVEAESYYLQAIEKGNMDALNNLAVLYAGQGKNVEAESYYLQAIKKGHADAEYNLAILYKGQGKNAEAEIHYLQAIEKGHAVALLNLAFLYYNTKQQPQKALGYIHQYYAQSSNDSKYYIVVLIEIWNGVFNGLPEKIARVLDNSAGEDREWFLTQLLCLEQKQLVLALFESEIHGKMLKNRYELIYYAALILSNKTDDSLMLRIPPELLPTVESIVEKVEMEIGSRNGKSSS